MRFDPIYRDNSDTAPTTVSSGDEMVVTASGGGGGGSTDPLLLLLLGYLIYRKSKSIAGIE